MLLALLQENSVVLDVEANCRAIDAAARPKANDYLYWVTVNLDTKETKFSRTLAEHNAYVEQYTAWCTANVGRCT